MTREIQFRLSTDKSEYLLGEPIIAYTELNNSGTEPVSVIDQLDPKYEVVWFYIKPENQQEEYFFRPYVVLDSRIHTSVLEPGKSIVNAAKIFYGGDRWTFKSTGKYQVRSLYRGIVGNSEARERAGKPDYGR